MNDFRLILLCSGPPALPALREILFSGKLAAIVLPADDTGIRETLEQLSRETGIPVLPVAKKDYKTVLLSALEEYQPAAGIILGFPFILPPEIFNRPALGFLNFHFGLLPACRGPQPVLRHMLNQDTEAGVTLHRVEKGIDTGPVIMQQRTRISEMDTFGTLLAKLSGQAAGMAADLLRILSFGTTIPSVPQDEGRATYYPKVTAADLMIDWEKSNAAAIIRLINACNPWNKGAGCRLNDGTIGITEAEITGESPEEETDPGTILTCDKENGLTVKTADHRVIKLNIIYTPEGFFSGHRLQQYGIKAGMKLG